MRSAELVAIVPGGARLSGEWYIAHCPAHDDEHESLSFRDGDTGIIVRCHRAHGCTLNEIAAALNLSVRDFFFSSNGTTAGSARPPRKQVAEYDYTDVAGERLYQVVRFVPKGFRQRRPNSAGGWIWNLDGTRRVPYRLPEIQGKTSVYIVEGEKDVHSLEAGGLAATTNAQGAGKWTDELTAQLKAAGVTTARIIGDNDTAGAQHARAVAASCARAGIEARIVDLPGLPPRRQKSGEDVTDWLGQGHTVAELESLPGAAWTLGEPEPAESGPVILRLSDVEPEEVSWLWPSRIPRGKLALLIGDPGLGKSFITLDVAARVTRGAAWPDGSGYAPPGDVVLLSAEDGVADTIRPRIDRLGGDPSRVHVLQAVVGPGGERGFCLADDLVHLATAIARTGAILVIIDPLSAYLGRTESYKDAEVRGLLTPLAALADKTGCAMFGVAHLTKDNQRRAIYRTPGSIGFVGAARVVLAVGQDEDNEARRLLAPVKNNLSAPPPTLAYSIASGILEWEPEPVAGMDADALLGGGGGPEEREERKDAAAFVRAALSGGVAIPCKEVKAQAKREGIAPRTLARTIKRLGVISERSGGFADRDAWTYRLPDTAPKSATPPLECQIPYIEKVASQVVGGTPGEPQPAAARGTADSDTVEIEL